MGHAEWIDRTAMALGVLMQSLTAGEIERIASELWNDIPGRSMAPEEAAEIYAAEAPPLDPGDPGDQ